MRGRTIQSILGGTIIALSTLSASGQEVSLVPISADGIHTIDVAANEIRLEGASQRVILEIRVAGWDPDLDGLPKLSAYQITIDSSGYTSGVKGILTPALAACIGVQDCLNAYGGACSIGGNVCTLDSDCAFPEFGDVCEGSVCGFPAGIGGFCEPAFITTGRTDYTLRGTSGLTAIDFATLDFRIGGIVTGSPVIDPGVVTYGGTLVLDVSPDAIGTFTINLKPFPATLLQDQDNDFIMPVAARSARITVVCGVDADCDDESPCTDDTCQIDGTCLNQINFDDTVSCCNPVDRTLTPLDDGNQCTIGVCDAETGMVTQNPLADGSICGSPASDACDAQDTCDGAGTCIDRKATSGAVCGDGTDTECNEADTCDGAGLCQPNLLPSGSSCGNPNGTDCNAPDTCDGAGACLGNLADAGTACGDPTSTDCNSPDTCDGMGACLTNVEPSGLPCGNIVGTQCDNPDTCDALGTCQTNFVAGGVACGNPGSTECDDPDTCDGAGNCDANPKSDGLLCTDDGNECRDDVCLAGICSHPLSALGTACGNPVGTECDNADACDGMGSCQTNLEPMGAACGDPTTTDCDRADSCDGAGTCVANIEPSGVVCGDPTDTDCNSPDTCNGMGMCLGNVAPAGLPCGNTVGNQCDNPDSCDGFGVCEPNFVTPGTACGNPAISECDNSDTCDGMGTCDPNHFPNTSPCSDDGNDCRDDVCLDGVCSHPLSMVGTPCGNPSDTECDMADSCDGAGTCLLNITPAMVPCGDPTVDVCTAADTCSGLGVCQSNNSTDGTGCDTGSFCTAGATCLGGVCGGGSGVDCSDGLDCTLDSCNEATQGCDNDLLAGNCLIDGGCFLTGELNPANSCQVCDPTLAPTAWTSLSVGASCNDGDACTDFDMCDALSDCAGTINPDCNDDCINAVEVFIGNNVSNNANRGIDDNEATCQFDSDNDVWFFHTAGCDGRIVIDTIGSAFVPSNDTVLTVYDVCNGTEIACDDDGGPGLLSSLEFNALDGISYLIRVAGFMSNAGDISLNIATLDSCIIAGVCVPGGAVNPLNECEACVPLLNSVDWSPRPTGSLCGDPAKSECDSPDSCDGAGTCESNSKPDQTTCPDDGNACSVDVCQMGMCAHPPAAAGTVCGDPTLTDCDNADTCDGAGMCLDNFAPSGLSCGDSATSECDNADICNGLGGCNPNHQVDGLACSDDGNDCTSDVCATGLCTHPSEAMGTVCGDAADTQCDNPDTCDGAGLCLSNFVSGGAICGDPTNTECDNPDSCNGAGACVSNFEPIGFACGIATGTDCDNPDSCDGAGACRTNLEPNGFPCGNPASTQCDNPDTCDGTGMCLVNFEPAGLACGNSSTSECDNGDLCDGAGLCDPNNQPDGLACSDEGIECTNDVCESGQCTHPPKLIGTTCGDQVTTVCDKPDSCDGGIICLQNFEPTTTTCGDPTDTDCDNPDTCNAAGQCTDNFEPTGFACGDLSDTQCDDPDTCDGTGTCLSNFEIMGLPCGDPSNTQCDAPDTCDGIGDCRVNFVSAGTLCGDPSVTECDNADQCTGLGLCGPNHQPDGTPCTPDENDCRADICQIGNCSHPLEPLGTPCGDVADTQCDNPDTCDALGVCLSNFEPFGLSCGSATDTQCDNPDICDGVGLCNDNFEPDGTLCDDMEVCTETDICTTGLCVGATIAVTPALEAPGCRYLSITPGAQGAIVGVALRVTSPEWPCLERFVSQSGALVSAPVFRLPSEWGTVSVFGQDIIPNTVYTVDALCGEFVSTPASARTALWGDVAGFFVNGSWTPPDGMVNLTDAVADLDAFKGKSGAPPIEAADIGPCVPDGRVDLAIDTIQVIDAFKGKLNPCPNPCSP